MANRTQLEIRLTPGAVRPKPGRSVVDMFRGGPETLLRWLETQLGLPVPDFHQADRITEFASALDAVEDSVISVSMEMDRWATASELLSRRDELLLAGWDETDSNELPDIVRDLARAAELRNRPLAFPCVATRLLRVLDALSIGQVLPPHECQLYDAPDTWPAVWREVLAKLNLVDPQDAMPLAPDGSALRIAQSVVRGAELKSISQDSSFRFVQTRSDSAAVEMVAAVLANEPHKLSSTVICCEDDQLAVRLDACLSRIGLPTTGASARSRAHPALQVLPLSLSLCWEPVDPQALLDFLTLPISPIPRKAAARLAYALTQEPGLGSSQWDVAVAELCDSENDPEGKRKQRLDDWLLCDRTPQGEEISPVQIRSRCGMIAQWAAGRAEWLSQAEDPDLQMVNALQIAAGQASLLGELAEAQGTGLSEPQLARLVEEALGGGIETTPCIEADGGPTLVRSLTEIDDPFDRLIWLGVGTADARGCRWTTSQLRQLRAAGIDVDDGSRALSARRAAEARGIGFASESFLAVLLPQDFEKRWHPLWLAIRGLIAEQDLAQTPVFEDLVAAEDGSALEPFVFDCHSRNLEPAQKQRPLWHIPSDLLADRQTVSASELQDRLGCPLKWTLNYQARLRSSSIAELPDEFQLRGTFCHSILERVFGGGGELPDVDDAVTQVTAAFDQRLPLDAAPFARSDKHVQRQRLRDELRNATEVLIRTLASGGYRIAGIEVELSGKAFGKSLKGWIDCVAVRDNGDEVVIDFKYGGRSKYYSLLADGQAVQLATYAYGRSGGGSAFPAVAYLVLSDGLLYTPSGSPIDGGVGRSVIDGPAIESVWKGFAKAIKNADDWLTSATPIPARPLQDPSDWPAGAAEFALDAKLKADQQQEVCRYCDYQLICGLQETT